MVGKVVHLHGNYKELLGRALNTAATIHNFKNVLFIDAENCFDSNYLKEFFDADLRTLENITVGFPKDAFDFNYLVSNLLEKQILMDDIKILFVSSTDLLAVDDESRCFIANALDRLRDLSSRYNLITIVLSYGNYELDPEIVILDDLKAQAIQAVAKSVEGVKSYGC